MQWYADNNVRRLDWPAQSPDLNPIEHLWDELDRRVKARQVRPKSIVQLMEWLQEEWRRILVDFLQTLVESMPDRVAAVIAARGVASLNGTLCNVPIVRFERRADGRRAIDRASAEEDPRFKLDPRTTSAHFRSVQPLPLPANIHSLARPLNYAAITIKMLLLDAKLISEVNMEQQQQQDARVGKRETLRKTAYQRIFRHDSQVRESECFPAGDRTQLGLVGSGRSSHLDIKVEYIIHGETHRPVVPSNKENIADLSWRCLLVRHWSWVREVLVSNYTCWFKFPGNVNKPFQIQFKLQSLAQPLRTNVDVNGKPVRLLASRLGKQGSIPSRVNPAFSHVGIVPQDVASRRVFSGISRFPAFSFLRSLTHLCAPVLRVRPRAMCSMWTARSTDTPYITRNDKGRSDGSVPAPCATRDVFEARSTDTPYITRNDKGRSDGSVRSAPRGMYSMSTARSTDTPYITRNDKGRSDGSVPAPCATRDVFEARSIDTPYITRNDKGRSDGSVSVSCATRDVFEARSIDTPYITRNDKGRSDGSVPAPCATRDVFEARSTDTPYITRNDKGRSDGSVVYPCRAPRAMCSMSTARSTDTPYITRNDKGRSDGSVVYPSVSCATRDVFEARSTDTPYITRNDKGRSDGSVVYPRRAPRGMCSMWTARSTDTPYITRNDKGRSDGSVVYPPAPCATRDGFEARSTDTPYITRNDKGRTPCATRDVFEARSTDTPYITRNDKGRSDGSVVYPSVSCATRDVFEARSTDTPYITRNDKGRSDGSVEYPRRAPRGMCSMSTARSTDTPYITPNDKGRSDGSVLITASAVRHEGCVEARSTDTPYITRNDKGRSDGSVVYPSVSCATRDVFEARSTDTPYITRNDKGRSDGSVVYPSVSCATRDVFEARSTDTPYITRNDKGRSDGSVPAPCAARDVFEARSTDTPYITRNDKGRSDGSVPAPCAARDVFEARSTDTPYITRNDKGRSDGSVFKTFLLLPGATVDQRLAFSPPTKVNRVQYSTGSPNFCKWEWCWTMPLVGGFSRGSPVSPPLHSGAAPHSLQSPSSVLETSLLRAAKISSLTLLFPPEGTQLTEKISLWKRDWPIPNVTGESYSSFRFMFIIILLWFAFVVNRSERSLLAQPDLSKTAPLTELRAKHSIPARPLGPPLSLLTQLREEKS
ncbi:hypothetical protein PR048_007318 [Dryococelus australis]|uniref:Tc1-like transposase DDE domain-containing protein n=1 Tax=Dryococelus australis TaxID=614101 RepID=A0ABQ9IEI4_9NEOP|nr:hypothetical protein PR048_007318 [Dryococelus australis]